MKTSQYKGITLAHGGVKILLLLQPSDLDTSEFRVIMKLLKLLQRDFLGFLPWLVMICLLNYINTV